MLWPLHLPAGNRPSLSILLPELNAFTLGQLLRWVPAMQKWVAAFGL